MSTPLLHVDLAANLAEYRGHVESFTAEYRRRWKIELSLLDGEKEFLTPGYCHVCMQASTFATDFLYGGRFTKTGIPLPNWRERVVCRRCQLNNRMRGAIHLLEEHCGAGLESSIYITEQVTPLYRALKQRLRQVRGSEYLGEKLPFGAENPDGIRNESITHLSFEAGSFDYLLCFDVLEHVPDYAKALRECLRCLRENGTLLLSVPFLPDTQEHRIRARVGKDGSIEHLHPPEYHGDPVQDAGCLSYYDFGWALLDELREAGFAQTSMALYWSDHYGYYGIEQSLIVARKSSLMPS